MKRTKINKKAAIGTIKKERGKQDLPRGGTF